MTQPSDPTAVFAGYRDLLFSIVYNLLGSAADSEDVLQETWLAWTGRASRTDADKIDNPRAYLVRIAVNQALARQAAINRRREVYVGQWLPEPVLTQSASPEAAELDGVGSTLRTEAVSIALLVVLETLTPLERAVFVLHDVFGYQHAEIAHIIGRSTVAIRQLSHRAREHVHARRPRYQADPQVQRQATERFVTAALGGDIGELLRILAPDVTLWTDGGGKARAAGLRPIYGREKVARLLAAVATRPPQDLDIRYRYVNGDPSALLFSEGAPYAVLVVDSDQETGEIRGVYAVTNPDKLSQVS
jgi:RNA polymerase sigma-70 factor (ECF subfamily)